MATIFEQIIDKKLPAEIVYEDNDIICIKDKFPKAPVHILLITKKVIPSIHEIETKDLPLVGKIFQKAKEIAIQFGIEDGYRVITNKGATAGQSIFHLHFHLLGGKELLFEV